MKSNLADTTTNPSANTHPSARTGKIARLPREIRQQLNQRLEDGESARDLVAWLNGSKPVQKRLKQYYEGRPITEQNLSDWRQGGFLDWQRHQETRDMLREFLNEAEELGEEAGEEMLLDRVANMMAVVLLRLFRAAAEAESGPSQQQAVLKLARELARLRGGDHQRQRLRLLAERQQFAVMAQMKAKARPAEDDDEHEERLLKALQLGGQFWCEYALAQENGTLTPARAARIEAFFRENADVLAETSIGPLPKEPQKRGKGRRTRGKSPE